MKFKDKKIAITADIHLGSHLDNEVWHDISLNYAEWLKTTLVTENIKDIVICGDVFNNRHEISVATINAAHKFFSILKDFNIFVLVGNHDAYYKDRADVNSINILHGWENITVISEPIIIDQFNKKIGFCPWGVDIKVFDQKLDVLFGHFEIKNFKLNNYEICQTGYISDDILNKANLCFSGHLHYKDERQYENGSIIYVGNPYQLNWSDYGLEKGFFIYDFKTNERTYIKNNKSPIHIKYFLNELLEKGISKEIKESFTGNFIKIVANEDCKQDQLTLLYNKFLTLKPLGLKIEYINQNKLTTPEDTVIQEECIDILQVINEFIEKIDVDNKDLISKYIKDIYNRVNKHE